MVDIQKYFDNCKPLPARDQPRTVVGCFFCHRIIDNERCGGIMYDRNQPCPKCGDVSSVSEEDTL